MRFSRWLLLALVFTVSLTGATGCVSNFIEDDKIYNDDPGFRIAEEAEIPDTTVHRQVLDVLAQYRRAVVSKDFGALQRLIDEEYYDNSGTTDTTKDDYAKKELDTVFEMMANHAESIKYNVMVQGVEVEQNRAYVEYEYEYSYQYKIGEETAWDAGVEVNQLELLEQDGEWKIISGL